MASDSQLSSSHCKFHTKDLSGEFLGHIDHQELQNPLVGPSTGDIDCPIPNAEENRDYGCDLLQFTLTCIFTIHSTLLDLMKPTCLLRMSQNSHRISSKRARPPESNAMDPPFHSVGWKGPEPLAAKFASQPSQSQVKTLFRRLSVKSPVGRRAVALP